MPVVRWNIYQIYKDEKARLKALHEEELAALDARDAATAREQDEILAAEEEKKESKARKKRVAYRGTPLVG